MAQIDTSVMRIAGPQRTGPAYCHRFSSQELLSTVQVSQCRLAQHSRNIPLLIHDLGLLCLGDGARAHCGVGGWPRWAGVGGAQADVGTVAV